MMKNLKQWVPSKTCLACDGCCRFSSPTSAWRPMMTEEEKRLACGRQPIQKVFPSGSVDDDGYLRTMPMSGGNICRFLNSFTNTCGIYHGRSFECRLYPFLLVREGKQAAVDVHLNCPYVQEHLQSAPFHDYAAYLQEYFREQNVRDFLTRHPEIIRDYPGDPAERKRMFILEMGV